MKKLMVVLAVLAFACAAQAAIIAEYTFTGSSAASSDAEANSTAGNFSVSSGTLLFTVTSSASWAAIGGSIPCGDSANGWNASSQATAKNFYFTVTQSSGYQITITSLNFLYGITGTAAANAGWSIAGVSQDTFARTQSTIGVAYTSPAVSVVITEATTISIEGWAATSSSGNFRLDNVVLNGTVSSIPEPATMGLLGLGALAMVLRRKMSK